MAERVATVLAGWIVHSAGILQAVGGFVHSAGILQAFVRPQLDRPSSVLLSRSSILRVQAYCVWLQALHNTVLTRHCDNMNMCLDVFRLIHIYI
jgi:hypothetical protein